jgi:hypothetical protein
MQASTEGSWEGSSGLDDTDRIYSFATVPDRDLQVLVGVDRAEAIGASAAWEQTALVYAGGATFLGLLITARLLREEHAARLRNEALAHELAILAATLTGMSDGQRASLTLVHQANHPVPAGRFFGLRVCFGVSRASPARRRWGSVNILRWQTQVLSCRP